MKQGSEEESDSDFADGLGDSLRRLRHFNAQMFQNIGAAALRGKRTIAVLGHARARARHHEGGHGGDVERGTGAAARSAGIEQGLGSTHASIRMVFSRMARAKPSSSSGVSPFIRKPIRKADICGVVAAPLRMASIASRASAADRSSPAAILCRKGNSMEGFGFTLP